MDTGLAWLSANGSSTGSHITRQGPKVYSMPGSTGAPAVKYSCLSRGKMSDEKMAWMERRHTTLLKDAARAGDVDAPRVFRRCMTCCPVSEGSSHHGRPASVG